MSNDNLVITGFYEEEVPQFRQGLPKHELEEVVKDNAKKSIEIDDLRRALRTRLLRLEEFIRDVDHVVWRCDEAQREPWMPWWPAVRETFMNVYVVFENDWEYHGGGCGGRV